MFRPRPPPDDEYVVIMVTFWTFSVIAGLSGLFAAIEIADAIIQTKTIDKVLSWVALVGL